MVEPTAFDPSVSALRTTGKSLTGTQHSPIYFSSKRKKNIGNIIIKYYVLGTVSTPLPMRHFLVTSMLNRLRV